MKNILNNKIFFLIVFSFFVPMFSQAAQIDINAGSSNYDLQDTFFVEVYLDTELENINAVDGTILFDTNLRLQDVIDSDSVVNFWIEKQISENSFQFAGIIPGGFRGTGGKLFTLAFETQNPGKTNISLEDVSVFLNDGSGTEQKLSTKQKEFIISDKLSTNVGQKNLFTSDIYPPESFKPEISKSESLFDGKWFLVFATVDKNSGISHYLIKEAKFKALMFFKSWRIVESPYVLSDQSKTSFIAIKAVDKAGNEVVERVYPEVPKPLVVKVASIAIAVLVVVISLILLRKLTQFLTRRLVD